MTALQKEEQLRSLIREFESMVVAFSGGVDSSYLLKVASEEIGDRVLAITAISPTFPEREKARAKRLAQEFGIRHMLMETDELTNPEFSSNSPNRCFYCKQVLFQKIIKIAKHEGIAFIAEGSNLDDLRDHRPGAKAIAELGIQSPLRQCSFTKRDIRERSRQLGLETWDLPSCACLASRIPYGTEITPDLLQRIEEAERILYDSGFKTVRLRHHGEVARIEVGADEVGRFLDSKLREKLVSQLKKVGYPYVTLDLEGYRTGSMNAVLTAGIQAGEKVIR